MMRTAKPVFLHAATLGLLALVSSSSAQAGAPAFYAPPAVEGVHQEAPPYAGVRNYGTQARAFRYGWFGAEHFYPTHRSHRDYYGDVMRWSHWRRY